MWLWGPFALLTQGFSVEVCGQDCDVTGWGVRRVTVCGCSRAWCRVYVYVFMHILMSGHTH